MPQKTKHTPMMEQYFAIKEQYPDAFLFYRLGDFYELFYEDAEKASQLLEVTLTSRNKNAEDPIPMCGVPYHAAQGYIDTLIEKGYKIAICEQMEDPKQAKGMVKREVVQVVTPGTAMDLKSQDGKSNNYLTALHIDEKQRYHLAYVDLSTGELKVTQMDTQEELISEMMSLKTKETVFAEGEAIETQTLLNTKLGILISTQSKTEAAFLFQDLIEHIDSPGKQQVLKLLLQYVSITQKRSLDHLQEAEEYTTSHFLKMDHYSKQNLELTSSIRDGQKKGTLLWLLDETRLLWGDAYLSSGSTVRSFTKKKSKHDKTLSTIC